MIDRNSPAVISPNVFENQTVPPVQEERFRLAFPPCIGSGTSGAWITWGLTFGDRVTGIIGILGGIADSVAGSLFPDGGPDLNAFQHCFWSCLLASQLGEATAFKATNIWESCNPGGLDTYVDLANNQAGFDCAEDAGFFSFIGDCEECCLQKLNDGELVTP